MFCDQCGTAIQSGQKFCSGCAKEITGFVPGYPLRSRLQEHIRLLAILWFAYSAIHAVGGVVLVILANTLFVHLAQTSGAPAFLQPLLTFVGFFLLAKSAAGFLAGWGLLQRESWARVLTLILAFVSLINFPFGTAIGIYTLWVLLPARSEEEYERYRQASAA